MATSYVETARDAIATAFAAITVANGFNNTVVNVSKAFVDPDTITDGFPHIGFELGRSIIEPQDSARTVFHEITEVHVVAYVQAYAEPTIDIALTGTNLQNKMETMVHDLKKKICTSLLTANITGTPSWNVELSNNQLVIDRISFLGMGRNYGIVTCDFRIRVRNMDSSFDD